MSKTTTINLGDGKYTIQHEDGANLRALRHGEPWRELTGDGMVLALVQRIEELEANTEQSKPLRKRILVDSDGENLAVRCFLIQLVGTAQSTTTGGMKEHMDLSGWGDTHPSWVARRPTGEHLTKAGAQVWLRHLFDLEKICPRTDTGFPASSTKSIFVRMA